MESPKLIGGLTRIVRDVGVAEDLAQDALVAALQQWPDAGVPDNPGAWLMATAKHRAIDLLRRHALFERKHEELGRDLEKQLGESDLVDALDNAIEDDLLRLMFIACHPILSTEARAELTPREAEVHGLVALMEIHASRFAARTGPRGEAISLVDQNRARWDWVLARRGLAALSRAEALRETAGKYVLQASITACHARAHRVEETDWQRIADLYEQLGELTPSPIIDLNRAVAIGMAQGPAAGLAIADALAPELENYHLLPAVRGDLLMKLGRLDEARAEFQRAADLTRNAREREFLLDRAATCGRPS